MPAPPRDEFQIGWISALPIEVAAARQMLDEDFGPLDEQDAGDTNSYTLGRVGKHYVVIASLAQGQYGTTSATTVATNMMRTFSKSLRIGVMVDIGAGLPSDSHDIRLGDIVVSSPEGQCGGVLQYDMGKVVDGKLERTGALNSPPRSLLTAIANMRAAAYMKDPVYPGFINKAISSNQRTRQNFGRPHVSTDRLFLPEQEHPTGSAACATCPAEWEVRRNPRQDEESQVHYGIIASGNAVQKHGSTRELLRKQTGAICFEMEAAGIMMDFPCIVVRGICDYADSHKNDHWQGYAALAAASYTKEVLSYVPNGHVLQEKHATGVCAHGKQMVDEIKEVGRSLGNAFVQRETHHQENMANIISREQQECHQALKTSTYEQYKNINPDRVEGTCRWVLENSQFNAWLNSSHDDLLWISADPGCGKFVLAKSLIDRDLPHSTFASTCYFFFKDNDDQNSLATALCAVLHQLFAFQPKLLQHAIRPWIENGQMIQQEIDGLWRILEAVSSDAMFSNTICIFDALDECRPEDRSRLINRLTAFYSQRYLPVRRGWLKFVVTSRPYNEIQESFRSVTESCSRVHLCGEDENCRIRDEISLVIKKRVADLARDLELSTAIRSQLERRLLDLEHRTYLWLHLVLDDIRITLRDSLEPEEESIQLIPASVQAAYERMLDRVPKDKVAEAKLILQIIIGARRPLTVEEMAVALDVARQLTGVAAPAHVRAASPARLSPYGLGEKIRHLCGLFVTVHDAKIDLIHQTAREFLQDRYILISGKPLLLQTLDIEILMGKICVHYLTVCKVTSSPHDVGTKDFLEYAASHWADHVRWSTLDSEHSLTSQLYRLYDVTSELYDLWFPIFWAQKGCIYHVESRKHPEMTPVRLAACNGHNNIITQFSVAEPEAIIQPDCDGITALYLAVNFSQLETVRQLINRGANVNAQGGYYGNALQAATCLGDMDIMRLLIKNGADINASGGEYHNALCAAVLGGSVDLVRLLIEKGAHVNACNANRNALQTAASLGRLDIAQLLIDNGANINDHGGGPYGNSLQAAIIHDKLDVARLLIENGANVNACGEHGNALQIAASLGRLDVTQLLMNNGANVNNYSGEPYGNSLQAAIMPDKLDVARLLIKNGANIHASGMYSSALKAACARGHNDLVQQLLEIGANVNETDALGWTALFLASRFGHAQIVQFLLADRTTKTNTKDRHGSTPIFAATRNGHSHVVELLLSATSVNINDRDGFEHDLLWWARRSGDKKTIQVISDYAKQLGTTYNDVTPNAPSVPFNPKRPWCDVCTLTIHSSNQYTCKICDQGSFCMCQDCFEAGYRCHVSSHILDLCLDEL